MFLHLLFISVIAADQTGQMVQHMSMQAGGGTMGGENPT